MEPVLEMFFFSSVSEGWADMVGKGERFLCGESDRAVLVAVVEVEVQVSAV
jgi:hypothetical protein